MKSKNLIFTAMVSFMAFALVSCNKDNGEPEPDPQPSGAILPSVISYSKSASTMPDAVMKTYVVKFEYDIHDRITKMHSEYFLDGVSVNHDFISTQTFTYGHDNDGITTVITRPDAPGMEFAWMSYYRRGSEIIAHGNTQAPIRLNYDSRALNYRSFDNTTDFEFAYDGAGNAVSMTSRDNRTAATEKYILVPGQGNGIFRNVKTPKWYITSQMGRGAVNGDNSNFSFGDLSYQQLTNNCVRAMEVDGETVFEYNYQFNEDNYPTRIIRNPNFTGGEYIRYEIEYTKAE